MKLDASMPGKSAPEANRSTLFLSIHEPDDPSHIRLFELQRSEMRADELVDRELLLNLQSVSSCRLVMFLLVMRLRIDLAN